MSIAARSARALRFEQYRRLAGLTFSLARRDIASRYRGSNLGMLWTLLTPLTMLAVYGLAFGHIFKSRWPGAGTTGDFVEILFVGLAVHGFIAECLTRAPTLVVANPSFVKRVVFPLGVLPPMLAMVALFNFAMILAAFIGYQAVLGSGIGPRHGLVAIIAVPLLLMGMTLNYLFAFLGVYFRDLTQVMPTVATALLFLSSAIVPVETLPPAQQAWFSLNPLTFFIDQTRDAMIWQRPLDMPGLIARTIGWGAALLAAIALFRRARRGFADVI